MDYEDMEVDVPFGGDFKTKTLEWAASLDDAKPSERLEFAKDLVNTFTLDEIRRLRSYMNNRKRDVKNAKLKAEAEEEAKRKKALEEVAAVSSSDAAVSTEPSGPIPWWELPGNQSVVAFDTEQVIKLVDGENVQGVGTIDVVDEQYDLKMTTFVHHPKGSLNPTDAWHDLTGFDENYFVDESLPTEKQVREDFVKDFGDKVIVTCGGISDYKALGLTMGEFNTFDLQNHWFYWKMNQVGELMRTPHSLRSLAKHYLGKDIQSKTHNSREDAEITMQLFHVYKKVKMEDDPENAGERVNRTFPYDNIPVLPNPTKGKYGKSKKKNKKRKSKKK